MKDLGFKLSLKCPYMTKDGYCTELKKPCPWSNDEEIVHIIERIRNCPYAGLFNTIESKTTAVLTMFFKSMGFDVEIDYNHASKYMDSLTIRGYRDGKMVFNVNFTESRRQIRKRIDTLRNLFYALISTV
uniref:Uncharacterized protein n=1 Tax=archaeon enrichment culture clone 1(2010) TaxID=795325 RepID=D9CGG4_9ARCH|nr:hypothetical protein pHA1_gp40 [archaeon enrichment culture clone 1(2010)]